MEWLTRDNELDMEVEIGYMPQMELESISASSPGQSEATGHQSEAGDQRIVWQEEIERETAEVELEKAMYPFKQVTDHVSKY